MPTSLEDEVRCLITSPKRQKLTDDEKIEIIAQHMKGIMDTLGLEPEEDKSLLKSPKRIAKMYVKEIFSGLNPDTFPDISFEEQSWQQGNESQLVLVKNICVNSFCEHHFVPMLGKAHIAYIPNKKIIGLSKINRICYYFSKRPQIQERLTLQIADCLADILETEDVAVLMTLKHFCVIARGIEDHASETTSHALKGEFNNVPHRRQEFFSLIR